MTGDHQSCVLIRKVGSPSAKHSTQRLVDRDARGRSDVTDMSVIDGRLFCRIVGAVGCIESLVLGNHSWRRNWTRSLISGETPMREWYHRR